MQLNDDQQRQPTITQRLVARRCFRVVVFTFWRPQLQATHTHTQTCFLIRSGQHSDISLGLELWDVLYHDIVWKSVTTWRYRRQWSGLTVVLPIGDVIIVDGGVAHIVHVHMLQLNVFTFIHLMFAHKSAHIILSTLYTCSWSVSESRCRSTTMLLFQINATILSCCGVCNDIVGHDHTIRALYISSLQVADGLSISATITVIELQT